MSSTLTTTTSESSAPPIQPDISYHPDYEKWQARAARRLKEGGLSRALSPGFPQQMSGNMVWEGQTVGETYDWTHVLNAEQLDEIDRALNYFIGLKQPLSAINPETFPLPTLHSELRRLSAELHTGHGFFVLRGLDVARHTREENIAIYAGVSAHVAAQRGRQDSKFGGRPADVVLTHITDLSGGAEARKIGSPAYTTDKQVFHTDSGDVVALFALETAGGGGGASKLASTWRVYNEIAATRPDLIHTLSENWVLEVFKPDQKYTERPLMFHYPATDASPERIALQYARRYSVGFGALPRNPDIPPITEAQAEALDTLHFLGERFCVNTDFQKGDIQYVNNLGIFHARDGFTDTPEKKRHLLRLWLRDPEQAWGCPDGLQWRWKELYEGITPESEVFPLEPFIRSEGNKDR